MTRKQSSNRPDVASAEQDQSASLAALERRRKQSQRIGQIDNSALYAGSPMFYYCKYCGVHTETKAEGLHIISPASEICNDCQSLIDQGWHDNIKPSFPLKKPADPKMYLD